MANTLVVEVLDCGQWVEVWCGTDWGEQQWQYETMAARLGYDKVRMRTV